MPIGSNRKSPCCRRASGTSIGATCSLRGDSFPGFIEKGTFPGSKERLLPAEPGARLLGSEKRRPLQDRVVPVPWCVGGYRGASSERRFRPGGDDEPFQ